jgi:GTP-binding protein Era
MPSAEIERNSMIQENEKDTASNTRCGYAAVVGRPNVGKSTLLNFILGQKLSIVTDKPQTTRNRILAVHNQGVAQIVFLDTPGLHSPRASLGRYMIEAAESAIAEADVCIWLIDMHLHKREQGLDADELEIAERLCTAERNVIACLNKIDLVKDKKALLPLMEKVSAMPGVRAVVPISGQSGAGVDILLENVTSLLPEGPKLYPEDMLSEQAERFFVAELVREALMDLTRQEIPYHTAVVVDKFVEEQKRCVIFASIHVERASQRVIVIGKGGAMIKEIGQRARLAAEAFLGMPVFLKLHVEVSPGWTNDVDQLKKMGYQ